jgi:hypothetical protein
MPLNFTAFFSIFFRTLRTTNQTKMAAKTVIRAYTRDFEKDVPVSKNKMIWFMMWENVIMGM